MANGSGSKRFLALPGVFNIAMAVIYFVQGWGGLHAQRV